MKRISLFFPRFNRTHFVKDVYLYPSELASQLDAKLFIYSDSTVSDLESFSPDASFCKISQGKSNFLKQAICIWRNAKKFDIMVFFHFRWHTILLSYLYKLKNPVGFSYVKGDMAVEEANRTECILKRSPSADGVLKTWLLFYVYNYLSSSIDVLSVETLASYNKLLSLGSKINVNKVLFIPNGIDRSSSVNFSRPQKEKVIINVARIGTYQKNTEFLLSVISTLDLNDWTFIFVGTIEPDFKNAIDDFFLKNPCKVGSVLFLGEIKEKNVLDDLFARSSIFCLSSRYESYGLVLSEAAFFNSFLITTDVGAASDLINMYHVDGTIVESDIIKYKEALQLKMQSFPLEVSNNISDLFIDKIISNLLVHFK